MIVQDDRFDATSSITCGFTRDETDAPLFRLPVAPSGVNRLDAPSRFMVDKISTVPKSKLGYRAGRLEKEDLVRLNRALLVFFGLAG